MKSEIYRMHRAIKQPLIISTSVLINALLFLLIYQLVTNEMVALPRVENINWLDFIQLEQKTIVEEEKKTRPDEPPPPEETPPLPKIAQPDVPKPKQVTPDLPMPNINVPLAIDGVPYLGDYLKSTPSAIPSSSGGIATNVVPTTRIEPVYPPRALRAGIEGTVTVEFTITTDGSVTNIEVIKGEPPGVFDRAVVQAVSRWKFAPEIVNGQPVEKRARQDIKFTLKR